MFQSFAIIVSLSAFFSYLNHKILKLPTTIGLMILALILASILMVVQKVNIDLFMSLCEVVMNIDFKEILLEVMLSFLLFAGALHTNVKDLLSERKAVLTFATVGVLISTAAIGLLLYLGLQLTNYPVDLIYCLLFGALISPTDPIAVLAIFKEARVNRNLELKISGESLFNDGVGVVIFIAIYMIAKDGIQHFEVQEILTLFAEEAIGGVVLGFVLGYLGYKMLKSVDDAPKVEVLITVALAMGGYSLASLIHVSGPLAMVVAGLFIGGKLESCVFSQTSRQHMTLFWEMLDEVLNAVLFVLIGLEVLVLAVETHYIWAGLLAIPIVLIGRIVSVSVPMRFLSDEISPNKTRLVMVWGGLRGGISVALALSISPDIPYREFIVCITYMVVIFSIIVQGLTIKKLVQNLGLTQT